MVVLLVLPVSARIPDNIIDYNDLITGIEVDGDMDLVTLDLPTSKFWMGAWVNGNWATKRVGSYLNYDGTASASIMAYPLGYQDYIQLDVTNIPSGTMCTFSFAVDIPTSRTFTSATFWAYYFDAEGNFLSSKALWDCPYYSSTNWVIADSAPLVIPTGAASCYLRFDFANFSASSSGANVKVSFNNFNFQMAISSLYRQQQLTGKTNELLKEVEKQLADQGKTMDEILNQQQQTNDKLDQLPDQMGDQMQGVIDSEKQEANEEGNKFVDQILDALPDPSTDVLAALKSLTDSTAYTGTDAVLPIPAIVLPGIDGLFPKTEIWGGTDFDFGGYVSMLPPALLTLVQSLFTIAIVLFCVYELKGIISYCLTLRESKGG